MPQDYRKTPEFDRPPQLMPTMGTGNPFIDRAAGEYVDNFLRGYSPGTPEFRERLQEGHQMWQPDTSGLNNWLRGGSGNQAPGANNIPGNPSPLRQQPAQPPAGLTPNRQPPLRYANPGMPYQGIGQNMGGGGLLPILSMLLGGGGLGGLLQQAMGFMPPIAGMGSDGEQWRSPMNPGYQQGDWTPSRW